jgi:hypothetical protein
LQTLTLFDIQLPGEDSAVAPLEGALRVRAQDGRFILETVDYGEGFRLLSAESEPEISEAVVGRHRSHPFAVLGEKR